MKNDPALKGDVVRQLANILNDTHLTEIEYEVEGCRIRVARQPSVTHVTASPAIPQEILPSPSPVNPSVNEAVSDFANNPGALKAPMVGTAYMSPNPGASAFVNIGDRVTKGQTLMIIEAMKVMNQIKAHQDGVVRHILVGDAEPIEYGQVLIVLE